MFVVKLKGGARPSETPREADRKRGAEGTKSTQRKPTPSVTLRTGEASLLGEHQDGLDLGGENGKKPPRGVKPGLIQGSRRIETKRIPFPGTILPQGGSRRRNGQDRRGRALPRFTIQFAIDKRKGPLPTGKR